ncbi:glycoside hydrolase family 31 protein [Paenibacillus daejeonensis]|uniref:glycoside hydrolase family 31 protein n=1 Tax=Paenibacillus daejeonensis TaxID=135193 RepID=UPI0003710C0C|nr:TIM-barrel domain-containing protein [Paenibacillus daejeonensis]
MQTSETIHPDMMEATVPNRRWTPGRLGAAVEPQKGIYVIQAEFAQILLQPVSDAIVRIKLLLDPGKAFDREDLNSTIAVQQEAFVPVYSELKETNDVYRLFLPELTVELNKTTAQIDFYTQQGELIASQEEIYSSNRGEYVCRNRMEAESHIYGLGEKTGFLDKKGEKYDMWNSDVFDPHVPEIEALYVSIPFLVHFQPGKTSYGLFLDNPGRTSFDMRTQPDAYTFQVNAGTIDYYFIPGPGLPDVLRKYSGLTGTMDIPPAWAIGYHQSRYSYMNEEEVMSIARTFKEKRIPCDVIYLDIHYMDEYRVFTFDPVRFPNPRRMIEQLQEMGIRIVPIVDPGVKKDPEYGPYQDGVQHDYFCKKLEGDLFIGDVWPGASAFPDYTEEKVRDWWGEQHRYYTESGIQGIWNDMNEPAVFNTTKTMDLDVVHGNDGTPKSHRELHNLYGMLMSMATQQGLRKQLGGERPFVLTRAGYAGIQKYAATWTGDNRSFWEHLAMSIPMVLNLGLSGQPFAGPDIGGFAHHTSPELLARWTQAGAFFPYCRNHSVLESIRQEPWAFGEQIEDICRTYIRLRYRFMPYLYTQFHQAHTTGMPVMRPLVLEYPDDRKVYEMCDQFLVGSDLLFAPILRPHTESRSVYLPAGEWIDYWTGERYSGGQHILAYAPIERMPMYLKAGALIAELADDEAWKPEMSAQSAIELVVYAGSAGTTSTGQWYEDDARTYAYEEGSYNLLDTKMSFNQGDIVLAGTYRVRKLPLLREQLQLRIKWLAYAPERVTLTTSDGTEELEALGGSWSYDADAQELKLQLPNTHDAFEVVVTSAGTVS